MILVCELSHPDGAHAPFNAGLLATIRAAFQKEGLWFFGAATHIAELKRQLGEDLVALITWVEISPPDRHETYFGRFLQELRIVRHLLRTVSKGTTQHLIFTSAYPSTILALKLARWFERKHIPVQMVLHGLNGVVGKRYRHPIRRFQDMKTALTILGNRKVQYLVLEEPIRDAIVRNLPSVAGKVEVLAHPLPPHEAESRAGGLGMPVRLGFLGLASESKGFPVFLELAKTVRAQYGNQAEFHTIGRFPAGCSPMGMEALATRPATERMGRSDFTRGVRQLHFVVLPHHATPYGLSASGTLLDAIAWGKPVIARRIPIFEHVFEKHGDIGYLFRDDTELTGIVKQILESPDHSRYEGQLINVHNARRWRSPEMLAVAYREICRRDNVWQDSSEAGRPSEE